MSAEPCAPAQTTYDPWQWPLVVAPAAQAVLRAQAEDFRVDEDLGFAPSGEGPHTLVRLRKRDLDTERVALRLADLSGVQAAHIGFAGRKDRRAVATQWFSVPQPWQAGWTAALAGRGIEVLQHAPHGRKLRRGALRANRFAITLRAFEGERSAVESALERISRLGVPNYFGEQRFGREGANLRNAARLFAGRRMGRSQRGLALSAVRAWLFNRVTAWRVTDGSWQRALPGEPLMLHGSRSFFIADRIDGDLAHRLLSGDVHPSAPLWGRGALQSAGVCARREAQVLTPCAEWCAGLERAGLKQERRALRLQPEDLRWRWLEGEALRLDFTLPRGTFATAVLREVVRYQAASSPAA